MRAFRLLPLAAACAFALLPADGSAQVGRKLEEVRGEDFWTFFNLQPTGAVEPGAAVEFRPAAGAFRAMVKVTAALDGEGTIQGMELALSREFVDDAANGVFARDIARSFLRAALPADDLPDLETLANEIEFPRDTPGYTTVRAQPAPETPAQPTPPYRVYLGLDAAWERTLEACTVRLQSEGGVLTVTVAAR
jgi:hypothetical protein